MPSPTPRRLLRRGLVGAAVVLVLMGAAVAFVLAHAPGNVSHPNLQFTSPTTTTPTPPPKTTTRVVDNFQWPWYGYDAGRTRFFDAPSALAPPLHRGWHFFDGGLLEFPPVIYHERMFLLDDNASAKAISTTTGRELWHDKIGTLAAASPAVAAGAGLVLMPVLSTGGRTPGNGRFAALSLATGRVVWSKPVPAGSESSPIVHGQTVYFGDQGGTLWARNVATGALDWTYHASGAIKGGPALVGGVLYFGDYAGRAYAVRAANGHQVWAVGTDGAHFGFGSGNFYSTPAVAFGRVYMGNTDGRVYSFGARDRSAGVGDGDRRLRLRVARCGRPARARADRLHRLVRRQLLRVQRPIGGDPLEATNPAGGSPVRRPCIGNVVYYSDLGTKDDDRPDRAHRSAGFRLPRRRVHPGHRRLPRDLPGRLRERLPAAPGPRPCRCQASLPSPPA